MCEFELPDVSLRCFVATQLLLRIYALSSVKFSGLKLWLCKKCDKYEVCEDASKLHIMIIMMMMIIIIIINMIIIIIMIGLCDKEGGFEEGSEANAVAVCHSTRK